MASKPIEPEIEFDPRKDVENLKKHGISLARATDMEFEPPYPIVDDRVEYGETRYRAFGMIDGVLHFVAFTYRGGVLRPISLRRANRMEAKRHGNG
jgi:uncharacterized DUF497 family protein